MKTLKFAHELVGSVLDGNKTTTWRLFDDKNLSLGDSLSLIDSGTGESFARARIVSVQAKKLADISDDDFEGHEKFADREEMLRVYRGYYGEMVDWDTVVKIINFVLL